MIVLDASVWISHLLSNDENHAASRAWFGRLPFEEQIIAPTFLLVEVAAGLARRTGRRVVVDRAIEAVRAHPQLTMLGMTDEFMDEAQAVAARLRLRAGDAIYVALAAQHDALLVTWDIEQRTRAQAVLRVASPVANDA